jgi:hypothetical protein
MPVHSCLPALPDDNVPDGGAAPSIGVNLVREGAGLDTRRLCAQSMEDGAWSRNRKAEPS